MMELEKALEDLDEAGRNFTSMKNYRVKLEALREKLLAGEMTGKIPAGEMMTPEKNVDTFRPGIRLEALRIAVDSYGPVTPETIIAHAKQFEVYLTGRQE